VAPVGAECFVLCSTESGFGKVKSLETEDVVAVFIEETDEFLYCP
jgi:hypothetical protein